MTSQQTRRPTPRPGGGVVQRWRRVPLVWRRAVVATAALWLGTIVVVVVAAGTLPARDAVDVVPTDGFAGWEAPASDASGAALVGSGLVRFDALWYLAIAADGYPTTPDVPQAAAFFPGYPAVVATLGALLGGRLVLAAHLVALLSCVVALAGLQRLAELVLPEGGLDDRAVLVAVTFPTAFFLIAPYAESLLLACAVWALVHAANGRPWVAALLAAAATSARPVGVLLAIPLLLGVVRDQGARNGSVSWTARLVPALGSGLALVGLGVAGWLRWGDPLAVVRAQEAWQRQLTAPWESLWWAVDFALADLGGGTTGYQLLDLTVFAITVTGVVVLARHRQWPLVAHAVANLGLWLSQPFVSRPLLSTPRFALVVPGVLLGLALAVRRPAMERLWLPVGVGLLALHLALFSRWWFVF